MIDIDVKERLKTRVLVEEVLERLGLDRKLNLKRTKNKGPLMGNCPSCPDESKSGGRFRVHPTDNYAHCFNCGESFDSIRLVMGQRMFTFPEACKYLAEQFCPDLLEDITKGSGSEKFESKAEYSISALYSMVFDLGKDVLSKSEGKEAYDYFINVRGYSEESLLDSEWISWPKDSEIRKHLKKSLPRERHHEIDELKLNGKGGDVFRAALPYRDRFGRILGFAKRATIKEGIEIEGKKMRWSYTAELKKDDLFGLYQCKRWGRSNKTLMLVEGLPDAAYLPALGFKGIVATGQGELNQKHIEGLKLYGIEKVIIAFDNDQLNQKGEVPSIEKSKKAADLLEKNDIKAFVLMPSEMGKCKDPEEYIIKYGLAEFNHLLSESVLSRARWLSVYFNYKYDLKTDLGRHDALSLLGKEYASMSQLDRGICLGSASSIFELGHDVLKEEFELARVNEEKLQEERERKKKAQEIESLIKENKLAEALAMIQELKKNKTSPEALDSLGRISLVATSEYYQTKPSGVDIGLMVQGESLELPSGGLTTFAAPTKHGKTHALVNVAYLAINRSEDFEVVFITLEELVHPINLRFLNRHLGMILSKNNARSLSHYFKHEKSDQKFGMFSKEVDHHKFESRKDSFSKKFLDSGRLRILDFNHKGGTLGNLKQLEDQVLEIKKHLPRVRMIVLDYLQLMNLDEGGRMSRDEALKEICLRLKDLSALTGLSIVTAAQFNRTVLNEDALHPSAIGEGGAIERQSALVFGMFNRDMPQFESVGKKLTKPRENEMLLSVMLNRHGPSQQKMAVPFNGNIGRIDFDKASMEDLGAETQSPKEGKYWATE
ncbi:MAG: DnaB-like helicase C-terminal domain-containing protein [Chlamydiales bacterium]|nr:DnaB-like helicase C-terminal domain-containing protein [Chlamydiales bacterium]